MDLEDQMTLVRAAQYHSASERVSELKADIQQLRIAIAAAEKHEAARRGPHADGSVDESTSFERGLSRLRASRYSDAARSHSESSQDDAETSASDRTRSEGHDAAHGGREEASWEAHMTASPPSLALGRAPLTAAAPPPVVPTQAFDMRELIAEVRRDAEAVRSARVAAPLQSGAPCVAREVALQRVRAPGFHDGDDFAERAQLAINAAAEVLGHGTHLNVRDLLPEQDVEYEYQMRDLIDRRRNGELDPQPT
jgi:hypothetical protein